MPVNLLGFIIGALFGAGLYLGGIADPDKIIGMLRLKDLHALKTIIIFVLVGMAGTWVLGTAGAAHYSVKPAVLIPVLLGGALLGIGFGLTGFCPGTGLACAAGGRTDALVAVFGMFFGALVYIWIYPPVALPLERAADFGKVTLPALTGIPRVLWVVVLGVLGAVVLVLTGRSRR